MCDRYTIFVNKIVPNHLLSKRKHRVSKREEKPSPRNSLLQGQPVFPWLDGGNGAVTMFPLALGTPAAGLSSSCVPLSQVEAHLTVQSQPTSSDSGVSAFSG